MEIKSTKDGGLLPGEPGNIEYEKDESRTKNF
jgi:hypothetical protein